MTVLQSRSLAVRLLHTGLVIAVFAIFIRLSLRHVGDSYFLADQTDQIQNFDSLLRLHPQGFWGNLYADTDPPAYGLGPLGALVFGLPLYVGLGVDAIHVLTSVLIVAGTLAAFLALARVDLRFAWTWLILFAASGTLWWNAAMLWSNTVLLALGCGLLGAMALCLRHPTRARLGSLVVIAGLALHVHLNALAMFPPIAVVAARTWRSAWQRPPRFVPAAALAVATALTVGPYLVAEFMTGFQNTRTILSGHAPSADVSGKAIGRESFVQVLQLGADPTGLLSRAGATGWTTIGIGALVAGAAMGLWQWQARRTRRDRAIDGADPVFWLVTASVTAIIGQAAFYLVLNRPLLGQQYTTVLLPFYAIPGAALLTWMLERLPGRVRGMAPAALGVACLSILALRGPEWADKYWERTDWTYTNIVAGVDALCGPGSSARTIEGRGFATAVPGNDTVLRYLMTRRLVACRYDPAAGQILVASMDAEYAPSREEPDGRYDLKNVAAGIALYRRTSDGQK
jgi:hypothetical protein